MLYQFYELSLAGIQGTLHPIPGEIATNPGFLQNPSCR